MPDAGPEPPIVIDTREELIFLLSEAAALEHTIMCGYLFASFTLKERQDEGLTQDQLHAVKRWDRVVSGVAAQEMLHLALVNNLLISVGAAPFFGRPDFPHPARYFAPGIHLALLPFGERALRHFLFLERPESFELDDAPGFEAAKRGGQGRGVFFVTLSSVAAHLSYDVFAGNGFFYIIAPISFASFEAPFWVWPLLLALGLLVSYLAGGQRNRAGSSAQAAVG